MFTDNNVYNKTNQDNFNRQNIGDNAHKRLKQ